MLPVKVCPAMSRCNAFCMYCRQQAGALIWFFDANFFSSSTSVWILLICSISSCLSRIHSPSLHVNLLRSIVPWESKVVHDEMLFSSELVSSQIMRGCMKWKKRKNICSDWWAFIATDHLSPQFSCHLGQILVGQRQHTLPHHNW